MSTIRLFFSRDTEDSAATIDPANYSISGGMTAASVTRRSGKVIDLVTTEALLGNTTYTVEATINDSNGNPIESTKDLVSLSTAAGPQVSSVSWTDEDELDVTFSEAVDETTAETAGHYTVTGSTSPAVSSATLQPGGTIVRLVLAANMEPNGAYNVAVSGHVKSASSGLGVETAHDDADVHVWVFKDISPGGTYPNLRVVHHPMAYDPTNDTLVYYRGNVASSWKTYTWNGAGVWVDKLPAHIPHFSAYYALCQDVNGKVIIYCGSQTWSWDGADWTQILGSNCGARTDAIALAYLESAGLIIQYGGSVGTATYGWNGAAWAGIDTAHNPGARVRHDMAYDAERDVIVLYGGYDFINPKYDTWEFDGTDWTQIVTANHPTVQQYHEMTYDPIGKRILLFGGANGGTYYNELWSYDGSDWTNVGSKAGTLPSVRSFHGFRCYDGLDSKLILVDGYDSFGGPRSDMYAL